MTGMIQQWGNSQGVRLPKHILEELDWSCGEQVTLEIKDDCIVIRQLKQKKHKTLAQRFEGYDGEYTPSECDWGEPVGREVW